MKRPGVRRLFSISLRGRARWEQEVEDEIRTHLASRAERLVEQGMSPHEAKNEAMRRFGSLDEGRSRMREAALHREDYMRRKETLGELRQDMSFAFRTLARNKGWAAVAVITLALGIGATTAVWSAASTLLLHPLSYPNAGRVVNLTMLPTTGNTTGVDVTVTPDAPVVREWIAAARSVEAIESYISQNQAIGDGGNAEDVMVTRVQPSFARFAGSQPVLGRNFSADDISAKANVITISEALWRTRYASRSDVLGQTLLVDGAPQRIVGVMPSSLRTPRIGAKPTDVWMPLDLMHAKRTGVVVARLKPGVSHEAVRRELEAIMQRIGNFGTSSEPFRVVLTSPGQAVSFRDSLIMLAGAVMLVLLVAAGNVAHLLLARAITRRREVAIRVALGASRGRLVRQMMTETVLLTAMGCIAGAGLGYAALRVLVKFRPNTLRELQDAHVDGMALASVIGLSLGCAVVFGLIAAMASSVRSSAGTLRAGAVVMFSRGGERLRSALVITEMALSAMLLVGAALLVRTVVELQHSDLGFEPKNLHALALDFPNARYSTPELRHAALYDLATAMKTVPGVEQVTVTDAIPSYRNFGVGTLQIEGTPLPRTKSTSFIDVARVAPSYFRTVGARLVDGRSPDSSGAMREVVVNEGFARKQWKGASALGRRLRIVFGEENNPWLTVVGVVHDIASMGPVGDKAEPFLYLGTDTSSSPGIVYRTNGSEAALGQITALAKSRVPTARVHRISAEKVIDNTLAPSRFIMMLMTGFTILALALAAVGLYGMMAYAVAQRTREIGIRVALGATHRRIAGAVVSRGAMLGLAGAVLGLVLAVWATRAIEGSLYGVTRLDPASYVIGGVLLVVIAVVASLVPMRRAVAVDPITAIRAD